MRKTIWIGCMVGLLAACSNNGGVTIGKDGEGPDGAMEVTGPDLIDVSMPDIMPDAGQPDAGAPDLPDSAGEVDGVGPACLPGEGCFLDPCENNGDCLSGWCVEHMGESVCTQSCQTECPQGWSCQQVAGTDPDVVYICVSDFANLCRPCADGSDCTGVAGTEFVCVDYGVEGSFCGGKCAVDADCPWGFTCSDALTVDGIETRQCMAEAGVCPCTAKAVELALWTPCEKENEFGLCEGKRTCTDDGLSDCDAPDPAPETCNGVDDNCDGQTDEETCDDDNACTTDQCNGANGCEYIAIDGGECLDGDPCTMGDHCEAGVCVGEAIACDDNNPCTDDSCDGMGGCQHENNQAPCDDADPCTLGDQCAEGICAGVAVNCDCQVDADCTPLEDGDLCNGTLYCDLSEVPYKCLVDETTVVACPEAEGPDAPCLEPACSPQTGACSLVAAHEGAPCNDGDFCSVGDTCAEGLCTGGSAANCNDGNPCTDDSCDPATGCLHLDNNLPCNDQDVCTVGDTCAAGECEPGEALLCDDGNACNGLETCDPAQGCLAGQPLDCDDGNPCNGLETCDPAQGCVPGQLLDCDDGNPCTQDLCDPAQGCQHLANTLPCDDGNACTTGDTCQDGACQPGAAVDCDDGDVCTTDTCSPVAGCTYAANTAPCNDGDPCTTDDTCSQGQCAGTGQLDCNDGNICTDDACQPGQGCVHTTNAVPCNDGNACTEGDLCANGACQPGTPLSCDDDNLCTTDTCHPIQGCQHEANSNPCNDGDLCTTNDACSGGQCLGGPALACNDGNPCTDDTCDAQQGCLFPPNQEPCDDGNACTVGDTCAAGKCMPGLAPDCNDANVCTDDSCDPVVGCVHTHNSAPCNDGNACTLTDVCANGQCVGSNPPDCNDGNLCTDDSCAPDSGCVHAYNQNPCDDQNACTLTDVCANGQCVGSGSLQCNDGDACTLDTCDPAQGCLYPPIVPCCGNGIVEAGEGCDDGNTTPGDGCDATCNSEFSPPNVGYTETSNGGQWRVCRADYSTAWISGGWGGTYNAIAICQKLGYVGVNAFGGNWGNVCSSETYDGNGTSCGWPPLLCNTVDWRCYR